jgi:hypothetical protein
VTGEAEEAPKLEAEAVVTGEAEETPKLEAEAKGADNSDLEEVEEDAGS